MSTHPHLDAPPLAYFITFTCYGTHLHGHKADSVDREHNLPGTPYLLPDAAMERNDAKRMTQSPYQLDCNRARIVLTAIREACAYRQLNLLAAHVRSTHVHVVVQAIGAPEQVMNTLKAYSSRALNRAGFENRDRRRWTRHGSTRYLWNTEDIERAIHYVLYEQGEPVSVYEGFDTDIEKIFRHEP